MKGIKGKTALVTGGASGFGAGIAERFSAEGADTIVADVDVDAGKQHAEAIGATFCEMDVSAEMSINRALETINKPIDILINNAGIGHRPMNLEDMPASEFERLLAVNIRSIYLSARFIVPMMKKRGGVILNIASTAGVSPRPGLTWYNATKGWVITATRSMAVELAPHNIRVNALNPVAGETPLLATFMGGADTPENRERFLSTIPLGRFSTPQDIASAACFLCSDEASMITGVALEVDGGRCV